MAARKQVRVRTVRAGAGRQVGFAVVGLGHFAQSAVLPAFRNTRKAARLVAMVSGDPRKHRVLGHRYEVPVFGYEQYDDVLRHPEVDAVYITLPNSLHAEYALRAAHAGCHVLCEKPMAMTEEQCHDMIRAAAESDVRLMVAYRLHFEAANLAAVEALRRGRIGEPRLFSSSLSFQVAPHNIRVELEAGGGVLWDVGIDCINAARSLFGAEPTEVSCFRARGREPRFAQTEEAVSALLRFPEDRLASFNVSFGASQGNTYEVVGTKGSLRLENAYDYEGRTEWELRVKGRPTRRTFPERDQIGPELLYFSDCILKAREPEPDGWEGLADVRIIRALYESARLGRALELPAFAKGPRPTKAQAISRRAVHAQELVDVHSPLQ
ncbi:MAG: Gfo/Idh/MocA family oxidoreductase [Myxococcaceae bacterium]|nr:Gfo/Idh/MocA family oxidoreductase [Myxococcaceae bacterium]